MYKRVLVALSLCSVITMFGCISSASAVTIDRLNMLLQLLRQHSGIMDGSFSYLYTSSVGQRFKITYTDKKMLKFEVVQISDIEEKRYNHKGKLISTKQDKRGFVMVYEDSGAKGPDGILDKVVPRYINKRDERLLQVSRNLGSNQEDYDNLVRVLTKELIRNPPY